MKICYVDESGHCGERYDPNQPVEVLCGVVTDLTKLFKTQKEHSQIMDMLAAIGLPVDELKAADIHRGRKEWRDIDPKMRDQVYSELLQWGKDRKCTFFICPIDCCAFFEKKQAHDPIALKLHFPWEAGALNVAMGIQKHFCSTKNNKGRTFIIFDEQQNHDQRFIALFEEDLAFTDGFTGYSPQRRGKSPPRFDQIVDVPHFSKSHLSVLIQLADLVAHVVNKHLLVTTYGFPEAYHGEAAKMATWYRDIAAGMAKHTSIDAPGKQEINQFYRGLRPKNWTAKRMRREAQPQP